MSTVAQGIQIMDEVIKAIVILKRALEDADANRESNAKAILREGVLAALQALDRIKDQSHG